MDITAVSGAVTAPVAAAPEIPAEKAAENRSIVQAVQALNGTEMFGQGNTVIFQRDPETHRMVIQVINRETGDVISQIPPEYLLRMAEDLRQPQADPPSAMTG
ncbi:MAG: flagellar protein FlaG [Bryobacteraceae bacterium]|jgi:uncharacterized FlaG/YvyC family protein